MAEVVADPGTNIFEQVANANLFAGAPELLAALKEACAVLAQVGDRHPEYHGTKTGPSAVGAAYLRAKTIIDQVEGLA